MPMRVLTRPAFSSLRLRKHLTSCRAAATQHKQALSDLHKYRHVTSSGRSVLVAVEDHVQALLIDVTVQSLPTDTAEGPVLQWGVYRASTKQWFYPEEIVPRGSRKAPDSGVMRTPLISGPQQWQVRFEVPKKLVPLHFGWTLLHEESGRYEGPIQGVHFVVPVGMTPGRPTPWGASVVGVVPGPTEEDDLYSINFAVYSAHASSLTLSLARVTPSDDAATPGKVAGPPFEVVLDPTTHRTGDVWHITLHGLRDPARLAYAWRAEGDATWADGSRFHSGYLLLDPYTTLAVNATLPPAAQTHARLPPPGLDSNTHLLTSLAPLLTSWSSFDWSNSRRPHIALDDTVLYEISIEGFTQGPDVEGVVEGHGGKFLGLLDRIPHLKAIGATSLVLRPVQLTAANIEGSGAGKPLGLFTVDGRYAVGRSTEAGFQLKETVWQLHKEGLEVLLQLEFCMTAEGRDDDNSLFCLRGLDAASYYRGQGQGILNTGHPVVRGLVLDVLRYWAKEYQVDGFVLLNAENMVMDRGGEILDAPPLLEDIAHDPLLRGLKIICSSGDNTLLPRGGEFGFPHWGALMEWQNRVRGEVWGFYKDNAPALHSSLATRIAGSPDLCAARWEAGLPGCMAAPRRPAFAVNSLLPPGDESLHAALRSSLPPGTNAEVMARSMLMLVLLSQGTPLFSASTAAPADVPLFISLLLQLRRKYKPLLCPPTYDSPRILTWHGASAEGQPDWDGSGMSSGVYAANYIAYSVVVPDEPDQSLYVGYNPYGERITITLPSPPMATSWRRRIDTSMAPEELIQPEAAVTLDYSTTYVVPPHAAVLFDTVPFVAPPVAASNAMGAGLPTPTVPFGGAVPAGRPAGSSMITPAGLGGNMPNP